MRGNVVCHPRCKRAIPLFAQSIGGTYNSGPTAPTDDCGLALVGGAQRHSNGRERGRGGVSGPAGHLVPLRADAKWFNNDICRLGLVRAIM